MTLSLIGSTHTAFLTAYLNFAFELTLWMWQSESEAAIETLQFHSLPSAVVQNDLHIEV